MEKYHRSLGVLQTGNSPKRGVCVCGRGRWEPGGWIRLPGQTRGWECTSPAAAPRRPAVFVTVLSRFCLGAVLGFGGVIWGRGARKG